MFRCPVPGCDKTSHSAHGIKVHCMRGHKMKLDEINVEEDIKQPQTNINSVEFKTDIISAFNSLNLENASTSQIADTLFKRAKYSKFSLPYLKNKIPTFIKHNGAPEIVKEARGSYRLNFSNNPIIKSKSGAVKTERENPKEIIDIANIDPEKISMEIEMSRLRRRANRHQEIALQTLRLVSVLVADDSE